MGIKSLLTLCLLSISSFVLAHDEEFESPQSFSLNSASFMHKEDYRAIWKYIWKGDYKRATNLIDEIDCNGEEEYIHCELIRLYISIISDNKRLRVKELDLITEQIWMGYVRED